MFELVIKNIKIFSKKMFELVIWWYIYSNKDNLLKIIFG